MSEVIKKWISTSIGVVMNMDSETFATDVMDGTLIAKILYRYKIIGLEQRTLIVSTVNPVIAFKNLKKIRLWLQEHSIECSEEDLYEISQLKTSSAIKFFYQLYLALHNRTPTYFVAKQKEVERLHPTDTRFTVTSVESAPEMPNIVDNPLSEPLVLRKDVIEWNQHKYEVLLEQYDRLSEKYANYVRDKFGVDYGTAPKAYPPKLKSNLETFDDLNTKFAEEPDLSYEKLLEQQKCVEQMEKFKPCPKEAKRILNDIKVKRRKEVKEKDISAQQQKVLLLEMWDKMLKDQEKQCEEVISKKMLKQSLFEKQMVTKMAEVRWQKDNMMRNRMLMDAELMKKREEEFLEGVFLNNKAKSDQKCNYYFERDRALELHRRLYREKLRLKAERINTLCDDCVSSVVDMAVKQVEYKEHFGFEVSERVQHEWRNLFLKGQPIFDVLDSVEDLMLENENLPKDLEEIYRKEFDRQNKLDEADFDDYVNYEWPWLVDELLKDSQDELKKVEVGMNVLGYNVHRALLAKYPKPNTFKKHNLPKVSIAVCINGLSDITVIPVLQKLVNHKGVRIIELEEAINYCLEGYKEEVATEYMDRNLIEESEKAIEDLLVARGSKLDTTKSELKKGSKESKKDCKVESSFDLSRLVDKNVQTPKIYPCEEIVLSHRGELGKTTYDLLNIGEQLTDHLLVAMFIEFLESQKDIKGWVLINYPTNFTQAALLEESLTGLHVPKFHQEHSVSCTASIGDISDLDYRQSIVEVEGRNMVLRKSKLVPNPDPPRQEPCYDTYLTAYIHAMPHRENKSKEKVQEGEGRADEEEEEQLDMLEKFYSDQGCNYAFYYKTFEVATIKHLAKLIIGDYSIPAKTSLELFGDAVLYIQQALNQFHSTPGLESTSQKKELPEAKSSDFKVKGRKDSDKSKVLIVAVTYEDKATQIPEAEEEIVEILPPRPQPRVGEPFWQYSNLSFPETFKIALGVFWENLEKVYVSDFKELFFVKRILMNAVIPYLVYVKNHMQQFIARPDEKQTYMYKFQAMFNEINADMREDEELKAEVHCRIAEFREKLWKICDYRMKEAEDERQRLIHDDWVSLQSSELTNNYITAMQLEIDRCCDSLQFIIDWYAGIITKMPLDLPPLQKAMIAKLESSKKCSSRFEHVAHPSTTALLTNPEIQLHKTSFHGSLTSASNVAQQNVAKWKKAALDVTVKLGSYFKPGKTASIDAKASKRDSELGKMPKFLEPEEDVKEAGTRLIEELNCAINGEALRTDLRIDMILAKGKKDLNDVMKASKEVFINMHKKISDRYKSEIDSVDLACEVLAQAVEFECQLQPELILTGEKFYIQPNVLLFPDPLPIPEPPIKEACKDGIFTIAQLDGLTNILMDLAPTSSMPERTFTFLLQDMIVNNTEDEKGSMVPFWWQQLQPKQVAFLSREIFGDVELIDWKDFIIYNMLVNFPTEKELLQVRDQFRKLDPDSIETVKAYQFNSVEFWFESSFHADKPEEMLRLSSIKQLLLKLYKIDEDTINYTALLLAFCKDVNPVVGFAKALSLVLGQEVCWDKTIGETYVKSVLQQRYLDEQAELERQRQHDEIISISQSITDMLIDQTVHQCDSVIIEDYVSTDLSEQSQEVEGVDEFHEIEQGERDETLIEQSERDEALGCQDQELAEDSETPLENDVYNIAYQPHYFLPFEALLTALTAGLPWHSRAQTEKNRSFRDRVEVIYARCKNEDFNGSVLTHELLNDYYFVDMLSESFKFMVRCPPRMVVKLVTENFAVHSSVPKSILN